MPQRNRKLAMRIPRSIGLSLAIVFSTLSAWAGLPVQVQQAPAPERVPESAYVLGPEDQVTLRVLDVDEIDGKAVRIDLRGYIDVPLVGRVKATGLTVDQLEAEVTRRLKSYVREPKVTIIVSETRSQPISVMGSVNTPGVYHLTGPSTLLQVLSQAGGLRPDAGNKIKITRRKALGPIPLPTAAEDPSGNFSVAEVNVKALLEAKNPRDNIVIKPSDSISIPRAELVYVVGAVRRPGGFILSERESMSVLQALSMAEGLDRLASPKNAVIIRQSQAQRNEVAIDVRKILSGQSRDLALSPNDILFIPSSATKGAALRGLEAAIQVGTGVAIWRR